jgi:hypothetical protein
MKMGARFSTIFWGVLVRSQSLLVVFAWACVPTRAEVAVTVTTSVKAADSDSASDKDKDKGKTKELPPMPTFSPEIEKDMDELMKKATEGRRKLWIKKMDKVIEKLSTTTGLADAGRKKLETSSHEIVETCMVDWKTGWERVVRTQIKGYPAELRAQGVAGLKASADFGAGFYGLGTEGENAAEPDERIAWTSALKGVLTPEQFAAWEKITGEARQKLKAEIGERLTAWLMPARDTMEQSIFAKADEMSRSLNLPKERVDQLKSLAKEAVDAGIEKMREHQEKWLADLGDEQRRQMLKKRQMFFSPNEGESPEDTLVWKTGLTKLLSADERKRLEAEAADHEARHRHALARLMVAEIDARVALTADQRQRIAPICDRLAKQNIGMLYSPARGDQEIDVVEVLSTGLKFSKKEVQAILEPVQWEHWLDACDLSAHERNGRSIPAPAKGQKDKPTLPAEPEDFERILANYLDENTQRARQKGLAESLLWAEDAGRAANLPAEKIEQLKTAARGAVEESLRNWKSNVDDTVHSFVQNTPVRFLQRRLENLDRYNFQQRLYPEPKSQAIWMEAFKNGLDAQQAAAAAKSTNEREAFRNESVAAFVVAMFDQSHQLTAAENTAMTTAATGAVKDYYPDIQGYFSGNTVEWYLQSYLMFIPVVAIPETELKSILGPESFNRWSHSPEFGNTMSYWSGIRENHDNRVKSEKK